jgi:hypothetical protein
MMISDVPVMDDAEEETEVQSETTSSSKKELRYDPAPQFPQSCGFGDYRDQVSLSPSKHIKDRVSALEQLPHSEQIINAVISAFIITPPSADGHA